MKKRRLFRILALSLAMIFTLAACGGKKESASGSKNSGSSKPTQTTDDWPDMFDDNFPDDMQQSVPDQSQGKKGAGRYDRVSEWDEMSIEDFAVQICDVLYYPGCSVADFCQKAESSEVGYTVYSDDPADEEELDLTQWLALHNQNGLNAKSITFSINDYKFFTLKLFYSDTAKASLSLNDIAVVIIQPTDIGLRYCRFFDGTWSYDDIINLNYDNVSELADYGELLGYRVSRYNKTVIDKISFSCEFLPRYNIPLRRMAWTGYVALIPFYVNICGLSVNPDSTNLEGFYYRIPDYAICDLADYKGSLGTDVTRLQNLDNLWELAEGAVLAYKEKFVINERIGVISLIEGIGCENLYFVFRVDDTLYLLVRPRESTIDFEGNLTASEWSIDGLNEDLSEAFEWRMTGNIRSVASSTSDFLFEKAAQFEN